MERISTMPEDYDKRAVDFINNYYTEEDAAKVFEIPLVKGVLRSPQNSLGKCKLIVKIAKLDNLHTKKQ